MPFGLFGHTAVTLKKPVALTELGKKKAEEMTMEGPKFEVLTVLSEQGTSSITEIAEEVHQSAERVQRVIKELIRNGYVRVVSSE